MAIPYPMNKALIPRQRNGQADGKDCARVLEELPERDRRILKEYSSKNTIKMTFAGLWYRPGLFAGLGTSSETVI